MIPRLHHSLPLLLCALCVSAVPTLAQVASPPEWFKKLDRDGSGGISRAEMPKLSNPLRPRAFGGKGAEGMKKEITSSECLVSQPFPCLEDRIIETQGPLEFVPAHRQVESMFRRRDEQSGFVDGRVVESSAGQVHKGMGFVKGLKHLGLDQVAAGSGRPLGMARAAKLNEELVGWFCRGKGNGGD